MSERTLSDRITFSSDQDTMEVDFSDLTFNVPAQVNTFYDEVERRLEETNRKWFFLVNYKNCKIMSEAWIAFAHRGKKVNIAYSLGSVRYAAAEETGKEIAEKAKQESFDPNLFASREAAVAEIAKMRNAIPQAEWPDRLTPSPVTDGKSFDERIAFHSDIETMEVDFSNFTFGSSADVRAFYDAIRGKLEQTGRKWYFMVNYDNTEILPEAWYQWSRSGKGLNADFSLGTVRYNPAELAKEELLRRGRADEFNPNLVPTREAALQRIKEMRQSQAA